MAAEANQNDSVSTLSLGSHFLDDTVMSLTNTIDMDIINSYDLADLVSDCSIATALIMQQNPGPHPLLQLLQKQLVAVERIIIHSRQAAQAQEWMRLESSPSEDDDEEEEEAEEGRERN